MLNEYSFIRESKITEKSYKYNTAHSKPRARAQATVCITESFCFMYFLVLFMNQI